jgi:hypothetical protein
MAATSQVARFFCVHAPDGLLHAGTGTERVRLGAHHKDEIVRRGRVRLICIAPGSAAPTKHQSLAAARLSKRTDLSSYAQSGLDKEALRLNQRPRKTLGFETPAS